MNQILSTSIPTNKKKMKNKGGNSVDIKTIIKFFSIFVFIFGIFIVGIGGYEIYNKSFLSSQNKVVEPTISIENKTDSSILLKVMHKKDIEKVEYRWNEEEAVEINGTGKYVEKEIKIPSGTNVLHVIVEDVDGNQSTYDKQYEMSSGINIEVSGSKIKITYNENKTISYMTYRWDEEDETTIQINSENVEKEIEAKKGLHTLTVVMVDEDNGTDTKVQKINGVSKPKLEIDLDETRMHFVIKASDDEKLSKIEFVLNQNDEDAYAINLEEKDLKELEYVLPMELKDGENLIEVTVYNSNGITENTGARFFKQ